MDKFGWLIAAAICVSPFVSTVAQEDEAAATPAPAPWGTTCSSEGRDMEPQCVMEQRVVMSNNGTLLAAVTLQWVADEADPMMVVQVPFGLYLPAGLRMSIDGQAIDTLVFQTCDNQGCFAGGPTSAAMIESLKAGNTLELVFQDQLRRDVTVPVSLLGFTAALTRIQ